mgnify:CR=1 FL=1
MSKSITILDKDYKQWLKELSTRYRRSQIKAAVKVNEEMLRFYWELGRDIVEMKAESRWGSGFMKNLSRDRKAANPTATCFSQTNLLYMKNFYLLYKDYLGNTPQVGEQTIQTIAPQVGEQIMREIMSVGWGHHKILIDKYKNTPEKALFYVHQTVLNGWSRNMLLNFLDTDLYERQGKALTNFSRTLPDETSDLAQELTKDPYNFAFTCITGPYNERLLKDKLLNNITLFLVELGTGFAYVGKEYRLQVGEREQFIDLLFYNLNLSCYVVIELKVVEFMPEFAGKLNFYVSAVNRLLRQDDDNPTIGLLICKSKDQNMTSYVRPLLEMGYIEMTEPEKPNRKNQKYRKVRKD